MSLCNSLRAISVLRRIDAIQYFTAHRKSSRITAIDHGAGGHRCTRPQIGEPVEIDIVEDARSIETKRVVEQRLQILGLAVLRAHARGERQDLIARGRRNQNLDAHEVRRAALASIFPDTLVRWDHQPSTFGHSLAYVSRLRQSVSRLH